MKTKTCISDFSFRVDGYGHYRVNYTSPVTGKSWVNAVVSDMTLIDRTKNSEAPRLKDLNLLKRICKESGVRV